MGGHCRLLLSPARRNAAHINAGPGRYRYESACAARLPQLQRGGAHRHRHHVFSGEGRGAELEFARGCPWACSFCNKTLFRNKFRERTIEAVLTEIDRLVARGVDYVYFIDEIFGVGKNVLRLVEGLAERNVKIGFQTRIDLWNEETLDLLGRAGCISMECGIESITDEGRDELNKNCRMSTERISRAADLCAAANSLGTGEPDPDRIKITRTRFAVGKKP